MKTEAPQTIDAYIADFPEEIQAILRRLRAEIHAIAPLATEAISYQMPTFKLHGNLVHFAAFRTHIGFYPVPSGIEAFQEELAPYITGRGTLRFELDQPLPWELIRRVVAFRVQENTALAEAKAAAKRKKK